LDLAEKAGKKMLIVDAPDMENFMIQAGRLLDVDLYAESKKWAILINGRNIRFLKNWKTPLTPEDEVWFIAGGG
jgi:molybdopterin converting factor small subunit